MDEALEQEDMQHPCCTAVPNVHTLLTAQEEEKSWTESSEVDISNVIGLKNTPVVGFAALFVHLSAVWVVNLFWAANEDEKLCDSYV